MGRIRRIYADTSVFGGLFELEFQYGSERLLELVRVRQLHLIISDIVLDELLPAPAHVRLAVDEILPLCEPIVVTAEAMRLRDSYLAHEVLTRKSRTDALHVALATVANCYAIVSWNFRHIVSDRRIPQFNAVNLLCGYNELGIFTPHGVIGDVELD